MAKQPILLILAAGMGSRYGGMKQIDPLGPSGETLMEYSLYDAWRAGFRRVVFVIREDFAQEFQTKVGNKVQAHYEVAYAYQSMDKLPEGLTLPKERTKPLGTAHAIWVAKHLIDAPVCVINADDYYGVEAFRLVYEHLTDKNIDPESNYCMAAFRVGNTLSENGTVTRGVCEVQAGKLQAVHECYGIAKTDVGIGFTDQNNEWHELAEETPVSMNCWGLGQSLVECIDRGMSEFIARVNAEPTAKIEYLLPEVISEQIRQGKAEVTVKDCPTKWFGVTYQEDKPYVCQELKRKTATGEYPQELWVK